MAMSYGYVYVAQVSIGANQSQYLKACLLYTSDAADERSSVDLGGRRIIKTKTLQRTRRTYTQGTRNTYSVHDNNKNK